MEHQGSIATVHRPRTMPSWFRKSAERAAGGLKTGIRQHWGVSVCLIGHSVRPGGTRTPNLLIRSQMLYPLSYGRANEVRIVQTTSATSGDNRRRRRARRTGGAIRRTLPIPAATAVLS